MINDRTDWRRPIGVAVVHDGSLVVGENGNPIIWRILPRPMSLATRQRQPFLVIATPLPELPTVTLYRDTWFDKITKNHVEMAGREDAVRGGGSFADSNLPRVGQPEIPCVSQ